MSPFFESGDIQIYHGDAREAMSSLGAEATACVTDPPYGLAFMGRDWDDFEPLEYQRWCMEWAEVVKSSMRPGAPLLAFSGTRTFHRAICGIEDAGFTVKDCLSWTYAEGFPKSHDLSKAVDQHKGKKDEREVVGEGKWNHVKGNSDQSDCKIRGGEKHSITAPATDEAKTWNGYGTSFAPSWEPICYATKPREGTYAENALEHGVAGLNIDGGRIGETGARNNGRNKDSDIYGDFGAQEAVEYDKGRWPANVVFDEPAAAELDAEVGGLSSGELKSHHDIDKSTANSTSKYGDVSEDTYNKIEGRTYGDTGGPSRYFYTSKASKADRNVGLPPGEGNDHPTVKPTDLMGWLLRLVEMPEENLILDPFCGSGTTLYVAQQMGLPAIGIDQNEESCELAAKRLSEPSLFSQD